MAAKMSAEGEAQLRARWVGLVAGEGSTETASKELSLLGSALMGVAGVTEGRGRPMAVSEC